MKVYSDKTRIKSYYVDKNGKLTVVQVFNFLQEAAFRHSVINKFGQPDLEKLGLVWMLSRLKVVFIEDAILGEELEINSWVRSKKGALSKRDFELVSNGKVVVKATSLWVCLSINPVKPAAIPTQIANRMIIHTKYGAEFSTSKVTPIQTAFESFNYKVKPSDVDMVNHTNNVVYVRMVLDAIRLESKLKQIDINYLLQSFQEDELTINMQKIDANHQLGEILNAEGSVVCRLKIEPN